MTIVTLSDTPETCLTPGCGAISTHLLTNGIGSSSKVVRFMCAACIDTWTTTMSRSFAPGSWAVDEVVWP